MTHVSRRIVLLALVLVLGGSLGVYSWLQQPRQAAADRSALQIASPPVVAIHDTNYPVPDDALFVATTGDDNNSGTQTAPLQSVQRAVDVARDGATIIIRAGAYREAVTIKRKAVTLQPYPHEQVWLKGSLIVTDWQRDGSVWKKEGWQYRFEQQRGSGEPDYPLAGYPDMVFIDGHPLAQVERRSDVGAGTFSVDYKRQTLYIGDNPTKRTVEATAFVHGLRLLDAAGSKVRGLGFTHYAAPQQNGSVRSDEASRKLLFERNTFAWNAAAGLSLLGADSVVRHNLFVYNGQLGFHGYKTHRLLLEHNTFSYNNQENFEITWEAGGVKITEAQHMIWRNNLSEYNNGNGMWCDISCFNTVIVHNAIRGNRNNGIVYEISARAIIASNVIVHNNVGISLSESESVDVYNNTLAHNKQHVRALEHKRTQPNDAIASWDVNDIVLKNNIFSESTHADAPLLNIDDSRNKRTAQQMGIRADYNAYYRAGDQGPLILWPDSRRSMFYTSLEQFQQDTKQEQHGLEIPGENGHPFFVNEAQSDYRLHERSLAREHGEPLPEAVADAIGATASVPVDLGALTWRSFENGR